MKNIVGLLDFQRPKEPGNVLKYKIVLRDKDIYNEVCGELLFDSNSEAVNAKVEEIYQRIIEENDIRGSILSELLSTKAVTVYLYASEVPYHYVDCFEIHGPALYENEKKVFYRKIFTFFKPKEMCGDECLKRFFQKQIPVE